MNKRTLVMGVLAFGMMSASVSASELRVPLRSTPSHSLSDLKVICDKPSEFPNIVKGYPSFYKFIAYTKHESIQSFGKYNSHLMNGPQQLCRLAST